MASMSMAFFVWATVSWKRCSSVTVSWDLAVPLWKDKGPTENRSDRDWARLVQRSNLHPFHWTHLYPFWTFREYFSKPTYRVYYCVYSKFENSTSAIWLLFTWLWVRIFQTWGTTAGETVLSSTRNTLHRSARTSVEAWVATSTCPRGLGRSISGQWLISGLPLPENHHDINDIDR